MVIKPILGNAFESTICAASAHKFCEVEGNARTDLGVLRLPLTRGNTPTGYIGITRSDQRGLTDFAIGVAKRARGVLLRRPYQ